MSIMKPLSETCVFMQSESSIDWGFHCPLIDKLVKTLQSIMNLDFCEPLKQAVLAGIANRFDDYKCIKNLVATVLHPALKKSYVEKQIKNVDLDRVIEKIVLELDLMDYAAESGNFEENVPGADGVVAYLYENLTVMQSADNKVLLGKYLLEEDQTKALLQRPQYGKIKKLFIKYNTQLLSSASSERLFSLAKHILTYSRCSLLDENFEKCVILNSSMKNRK